MITLAQRSSREAGAEPSSPPGRVSDTLSEPASSMIWIGVILVPSSLMRSS
jgi:hypothetical protein